MAAWKTDANGELQVSLVVAVAENGVIGAGGKLPWSLPSELKRFKEVTMNHPIVMGRRTYDSIGRALPGRDNIVVTRRAVIDDPAVHTVNSIEEALALASRLAASRRVNEIMVIGGAEIFEQVRPHADRIYLTRVHAEFEGDTYFPELEPARWREIDRQDYQAGPKDNADYSIAVLERVRPPAQG